MYVIEILERCTAVAERSAGVYRSLANQFQHDEDRLELWRELALEEETHAEVLRRELKTFQESDQSGAFLPEYSQRLETLEARLKVLESRAAVAASLDEALAVSVALEQTTLEDIYDDLVLQGEPAFRVISERIEAVLTEKPKPSPAVGMARQGRLRPSSARQ
ncbi:MAG TPA: hypothetical protein VMT89_09505 [Candidatus Acidoferrales bacterium]|nr:hypothetical protein [Candidatus Acidoferrales bacterium]